MIWCRSYRCGARPRVLRNIAEGGQYEHVINGLRAAVAQEKAVKRPRRWLLAALEAKIAVIAPRVVTLDRVNVVEQVNCQPVRS